MQVIKFANRMPTISTEDNEEDKEENSSLSSSNSILDDDVSANERPKVG